MRFAMCGLRAFLFAGLASQFLLFGALAQQPAPPQSSAVSPSSNPAAAQPPLANQTPLAGTQAQPPAPAKKPGFLEEIGNWLEKSAKEFSDNWNKTGRSLSEFGDRVGSATKDATDAVAKLSSTRVVTGNERCELAPNGSPDCRKAAEAVCRAKGFTTGQSIDTQSARKCPASVWLSGRVPEDRDCSVETFVTRAACQQPR